jgi:hydrogenase maturation protein HypF
MLPYSPVHHLLLADAGRPLVMTSGNLSDEPIAFTNEDAARRLGGIADLIVVHDREIHTRCDDSVATVIADAPAIVRRSRGYVPRAIQLKHPVARPVLATGALLKNTFCLASGSRAFLGPHIGDLENLETYDSFTTAIERFHRFVDIRPELVACDMHPEYMSTAYAGTRSEPVVKVQHHHAHVVAAMAEHGLDGPVLGIAYDGTGFGTDGTSWGGELLLAMPAEFDRLATFRSIALVGGDRAVHEPWRVAIALLIDAFDGVVPAPTERLMRSVTAPERETMASLIRNGVQVSRARGVGRYFDGVGALFLNRRRAAFEGQVALEWNQVAEPSIRRSYPFDIDERCAVMEIDLRPAVRAAVSESLGGVTAAEIAAAFHNTLAAATAAVVARAAMRVGRVPVVASGGCFQNARLAESVRSALAGFDVRLHSQVPPGDGGIALGQAVVADAVTRD